MDASGVSLIPSRSKDHILPHYSKWVQPSFHDDILSAHKPQEWWIFINTKQQTSFKRFIVRKLTRVKYSAYMISDVLDPSPDWKSRIFLFGPDLATASNILSATYLRVGEEKAMQLLKFALWL